MINYIQGDATNPIGKDSKIIVHICNDVGAWGAGFVLALSNRWQYPEKSYREWHTRRNEQDIIPFELGEIMLVQVEWDIIVANLIGQEGTGYKNGIPPIRYKAVREGLQKVYKKTKRLECSVHIPRIGCGLAGGKWEKIEPIIIEELINKGIKVTVYDL